MNKVHTSNTTNIKYQPLEQFEQSKPIVETKSLISTSQNIKINKHNISIANKVAKISSKSFITNIKYFEDICNSDENEAIVQLEYLLSKCSKAKIQKWLSMKFKPNNDNGLYNPIGYSIYKGKIKITKQLLTSFNNSKYSKLEEFFSNTSAKIKNDRFHYEMSLNYRILQQSLKYNDSELTMELIRFYEQYSVMSYPTYVALVFDSINKDEINILQKALASYYNVYGKHLSVEHDIEDTTITKI